MWRYCIFLGWFFCGNGIIFFVGFIGFFFIINIERDYQDCSNYSLKYLREGKVEKCVSLYLYYKILKSKFNMIKKLLFLFFCIFEVKFVFVVISKEVQ